MSRTLMTVAGVALGFSALTAIVTSARAQERVRCNYDLACQAKRDGVPIDVARQRDKADLSCMRKAGFSRAQWRAYAVDDARAAVYRACIANVQ